MLNIARQIYAGWDTKTLKYDLPEAEIVPLGDSANEKKRADTVAKKFSAIYEHENIPLPGFTLYKTDKKNWGSLEQTWLVIDPRGFLVRITAQNLEKILHVTGITEGLIQEKCVWAREDTQTKMTLVPVSSPSYIDAVKNTELIEGKVSMKNVNIGDTVIMQNNFQGIYRGILSLYGPLIENRDSSDSKPQVMLRRQIVEFEPGKFFYQADAKILKVIKPAEKEITREESAEYINAEIAKGSALFTTDPNWTGRMYSSRGMIRHVSVHAVPKLKISFDEIDELEATKLFYDSLRDGDSGNLVVENSTGHKHIIEFPYNFGNAPTTSIHAFDISKATLDDAKELLKTPDRKTSFYQRNKPGTHALDKFTKFYKIVKHVKNETYV
jgi:hypothetical protein